MKPVIALTMGDPSGIGPEIVAKALSGYNLYDICTPVLLGDQKVINRAIKLTGVDLDINIVESINRNIVSKPGTINLLQCSCLDSKDFEYAKPTVETGKAVYQYITIAVDACLSGVADAMVTAPINKEALNSAGYNYPGHTELIAQRTNTNDVVMMLAGNKLKVTLASIHEPLSKVHKILTFQKILSTIKITYMDLKKYFCTSPRIAVLSLNPHAGEGGLFGSEEKDIISPAILAAQKEGIDAVGPMPADTLFHFAAKGDYDAVVCMYHDQGLIPLKLLHFYDGVNITLGLPIIRTSVDHGTAYNLVGKGVAREDSMVAAVKAAVSMVKKKTVFKDKNGL
ncbi:MAG: 4-hydroxythreonine-4-phosphate dehydrogenase PdxA [Desulfuromonadales bacterium]|nr:4-hydroxythreonine-4-phosphate dehydrogenase PdxA [Desulfuromonadales bacterium]